MDFMYANHIFMKCWFSIFSMEMSNDSVNIMQHYISNDQIVKKLNCLI